MPNNGKPKLDATRRTLSRLRDRGYTVDVCEKFIARVHGKQAEEFGGGYRKDLFGFQDVQAYKPGVPGVFAIQSTSRQQMAAHLKSYRRAPEIAQKIRDWLASGNRFSIVGWERVMVPKANGDGFKPAWKIHEMPVDADMLIPNAADLKAIAEAEEEAARVKEERAKKRAAKRTTAQRVRDETKALFTVDDDDYLTDGATTTRGGETGHDE